MAALRSSWGGYLDLQLWALIPRSGAKRGDAVGLEQVRQQHVNRLARHGLALGGGVLHRGAVPPRVVGVVAAPPAHVETENAEENLGREDALDLEVLACFPRFGPSAHLVGGRGAGRAVACPRL